MYLLQTFWVLLFITLPPSAATTNDEGTPIKFSTSDIKIVINGSELADDLLVVRKIRRTFAFLVGLGSLPPSSLGVSVLGESPIRYLVNKVDKIVVELRDDCDGEAYVLPVERSAGKKWIHVCRRAENLSVQALASVLLHEARHLDGAEHAHAVCNRGVRKNKRSCDNKLSDGGSYAVSAEFLSRLLLSEKIGAANKALIRRDLLINLYNRYNVLPFDLVEGALLIAEDGQNFFFDGSKTTKVELPVSSTEFLTSRYGILTVYNGEAGTVNFYGQSAGFLVIVPDIVMSYYSNKLEREERQNLVDVVYTKNYVCLLREKSMSCAGRDGQFFEKKLPEDLRVSGFIYLEKRSRYVPPGVLHIATVDEEMVALPGNDDQLKSVLPQEWHKIPFPPKQYIQLPAKKDMALLPDGVLLLLDHHTQTQRVLDIPKVKRMVSPIVWSDKDVLQKVLSL